ncbi:tyrosine-type recombinase/integrase [Natronomonas amylolytica]|uniref:tyrosine-type recombinase/integrase n=1 Tax=Natronomonas amylolytica TaxID=3108498 RepID=UPI00300928DE
MSTDRPSDDSRYYDIAPEDAVQRFVQSKSRCVNSTKRSYRNQLTWFAEWCEAEGIESMKHLDGYLLNEYKEWRRTEGNAIEETLSPSTLKGDMKTLRDFLEWCWRREYVGNGLHLKVEIPRLDSPKERSENRLTASESIPISNYLEKFEHAELRHAVWALLMSFGGRPTGLVALDVKDFERDGLRGILRLRNRPDEGTRLKNGNDSERNITISPYWCEVLEDWLAEKRPDMTDDHGREPLLATSRGRISPTTIRRYTNQLTRPCVTQSGCPHGRSTDDCEALTKDTAQQCPSSKPPKAVRSGYISFYLKRGVPVWAVAERCDVSRRVLRRHYDLRSEEERRKQRTEEFFGKPSGHQSRDGGELSGRERDEWFVGSDHESYGR